MHRYTAQQIGSMRAESRAAGCTAPGLWWSGRPEYLMEVCNGVGAESAPPWQRDALSWVYRNYPAAYAIHDCRYEESDGTQNNRADADVEARDNALRLWARHYGALRWLHPAAYIGRAKINAAHVALRLCGDTAWQAAYTRRIAREEACGD